MGNSHCGAQAFASLASINFSSAGCSGILEQSSHADILTAKAESGLYGWTVDNKSSGGPGIQVAYCLLGLLGEVVRLLVEAEIDLMVDSAP
jgi:hypothetical protein